MIVVDGATLLYVAKQQSIVEFSKKRATVRANKNEITGMAKEVAIEGASLEVKDYNTLKFDGQNLILNLHQDILHLFHFHLRQIHRNLLRLLPS